jgi:hypothetical protein
MFSANEKAVLDDEKNAEEKPIALTGKERRLANLVGGSRKGKKNKLPRTMKDDVLKAFDKLGRWRYIVKQAETNPKAVMHLFSRCIPQEIAGSVQSNLTVLVQQLAAPVGPVRGVLSSPVAADVFDLSQPAEAVAIPCEKDDCRDESTG